MPCSSAAPAVAFDPGAAYGPCTAPLAQRSPDNAIDMGTSFDCFDAASHTAAAAIDIARLGARGGALGTQRTPVGQNLGGRDALEFLFQP